MKNAIRIPATRSRAHAGKASGKLRPEVWLKLWREAEARTQRGM